MGTPLYAKEILEELIKSKEFEVVLVVTQMDKKVGRKKILTPPPVKVLANEYNIEVLQPKSLRDEEVVKKIKSLKPDFIVVAAFGMLLPKEILEIAPSINLHASILPKYRGASPIQQAILNCDRYSGVTAMLMDEGLDTGEMLGFRYVKIENLRVDEVTKLLTTQAAKLTLSVLREFERLNPIKQLHSNASVCKKIKKEDGLVDFSDAKELITKFRAFFGWPGVFLENGVKLIDIELVESSLQNQEGKILEILKDSIIVGCKKGKIKINMVQPKSKSKMSAKAYIVGQRKRVGDSFI